uniref:Uncharacterized protein n=1 Tax=Kalanchoe fedtschenkoi TaxID=63787 RepID=A0A7N1A1I9_KALFE
MTSGETQQDEEKEKEKPIRTCKFYGSNFRRPRVYPSRTIRLIHPPQAPFAQEDRSESNKHGAAQWTLNGLGSKRFRLQGKVEGNLNRLRMDHDDGDDPFPFSKENVAPSSSNSHPIPHPNADTARSTSHFKPKPKPLVCSKRSRYASLIDEEEEEPNNFQL